MAEALLAGLLLGLPAGIAPGPLLALVVAQTLRHGAAHGIRVALAPLVTDLPIVVAAVLVAGLLARSEPLLGAVSLAGAVVVAAIARDLQGTGREASAADAGSAAGAGSARGAAPGSWRRGVAVNLLSPHPWLFWLTVGGPALTGAVAADGPRSGAAFVVGFYAALVGSKAAIAVATARAGRTVGGAGRRRLLRALAVALAAFAIALALEGLRLLGVAAH